MMHKILALWAVPRSTSTAFEWMMRMRGDHHCFHEPFGEAWYQGAAPLWPRATPDSLRTPGLTLDSVWQTLRDAVANGPVFSKDFPHYVETIWSDDFLDAFTHSFLIRDPAKTLVSLFKHWDDVHLDETGFLQQHVLFQRLADRDGAAPPVIDSDDLLERPHETVAGWCQAVGIPFLPEALSWDPGARDEVSWWDGGVFHDTLRKSDGLKPQTPHAVNPTTLPEPAKRLYDQVLPAYLALHEHKLSSISVMPSLRSMTICAHEAR
ncbi:MAG: hypothetical protein AAFX39_05745, partial [Pseudomonadota bacterium]